MRAHSKFISQNIFNIILFGNLPNKSKSNVLCYKSTYLNYKQCQMYKYKPTVYYKKHFGQISFCSFRRLKLVFLFGFCNYNAIIKF